VPLPAEWSVIRPAVLIRDNYRCRYGELADETWNVPCPDIATEVDHMGDANDHRMIMLRSICKLHHQKRTGKQAAVSRWARNGKNAGGGSVVPEVHPALRRKPQREK
jgi:5-methylcytosine-specific restriction enzyme A